VGQFADEADRIRQEDVLVGRKAQPASGGVQRCEQLVFGQDIRAGEPVEQGGFAGVGIADNRGEGEVIALAGVALRRPLPAHRLQVPREAGDAVLHAAAVGFQLRFTLAAAHADAALLARQVAPEPCQPGQKVLELGQFDLEFALARASALGEDVQDQRGAVQDLAVEGLFQVAALGGAQLVIEDDRIDVRFAAVRREFLGLAFADVGCGARGGHLLEAIPDHLAPGTGGQLRKLIQ